MKEKIYTIPVNEAFGRECECPLCVMYQELENNAVEYTMGPAYMEDDIRAETDRLGFCQKHLKKIYEVENRLGFALVMKTHMDKVISEIEKRNEQPVKVKSFFKKAEMPGVSEYIRQLDESCFVCERIKNTFERYVDTVLHLYQTDSNFKEKYKKSNGFCTKHYGMLLERGIQKLSGSEAEEFCRETNSLYIENMKRVRDDVEWFINKFDHKYADEPWKNAKDSLVRAMTKDSSLL